MEEVNMMHGSNFLIMNVTSVHMTRLLMFLLIPILIFTIRAPTVLHNEQVSSLYTSLSTCAEAFSP